MQLKSQVALIWAMSQNQVIGNKGQLPWHLPGDLQFFKQVTEGKPVIMGRKTYESIGRPLPDRVNIVVTRDSNFQVEGCHVVHTIDSALELGDQHAGTDGEIIVMGGAEVYNLALPYADKLYVTHVHAEVEGDTLAPTVDFTEWEQVLGVSNPKQEGELYDYSFCIYEKPVQGYR